MRKIAAKEIGLRLALAGIGTALSVAFIALSYYVSVMSLSFTVLSAVGILLPLCRDFYREGILTSIVAGLIGFFIANVRIVPYAMASGLYVVLTVFLYKKRKAGVLWTVVTTVLKMGYSCLIFWILYKVTGIFVVNLEKLSFLNKFNATGLYAILNAAFTVAFILYDLLLIEGYKYAQKISDKYLKSKNQ